MKFRTINIGFTYDVDGLRTSKTIPNVGLEHKYYYVGDRLQYETLGGSSALWYFYDADGNPSGIRYKNGDSINDYYFVCNWRGDVIQIYNASGTLVGSYTYDAWGKVTENATSADTQNITETNPIRYRGYYYDTETRLYYLKSRYYDPAVKRFLNEDGHLSDDYIIGYNLFTYCYNNPVNMVDDDGDIPRWMIVGIVHMAISGTRCWSWYYRAKTMIASVGNAYLSYKGYSLSRALFNHGMWGHGRRLSKSTNNLIVDRLKRSSIMKNAISNIIKKANGNRINTRGSVEFTAKDKINADLYYSLQHVSFSIKGIKKRGVWYLTISVHDTYDFDNIRSFSKFSFGNAANDLGWAMQRVGMMTPYRISVTYNIKW